MCCSLVDYFDYLCIVVCFHGYPGQHFVLFYCFETQKCRKRWYNSVLADPQRPFLLASDLLLVAKFDKDRNVNYKLDAVQLREARNSL